MGVLLSHCVHLAWCPFRDGLWWCADRNGVVVVGGLGGIVFRVYFFPKLHSIEIILLF